MGLDEMTHRELLHRWLSAVTLRHAEITSGRSASMTMPQVDNCVGNMEDYCDVYHLDTAVIIWRAEDVGANRARD